MQNLPRECQRIIISFLPPQQVHGIALVCHTFYKTLYENSHANNKYWKYVYGKNWQHAVPMEIDNTNNLVFWHAQFLERLKIEKRFQSGKATHFSATTFARVTAFQGAEGRGITCIEAVTPQVHQLPVEDAKQMLELEFVLTSSYDKCQVVVWRNVKQIANVPPSANVSDEEDEDHDDDEEQEGNWVVYKKLIGHVDLITSIKFVGFTSNWNNFNQQRAIVATCSCDSTLRLWDIYTGECLQVLLGHTDWIKNLLVIPNGTNFPTHIVSGGKDKIIRYWNIQNGTCETMLHGNAKTVWCFDYVQTKDASKRLLAVGGEDKHVRIYDMNTFTLVASHQMHSDLVSCIAFVANSTHLLVSGSYDKSIVVYNITNQAVEHVIKAHHYPIASLKCSSTKIFACCTGGYLYSFILKTAMIELAMIPPRRLMGIPTSNAPQLYTLQYVDGKIAANIESNNNIILWNENSLLPCGTLKGPCTALCIDGHKVLAGFKNSVALKVWEFN